MPFAPHDRDPRRRFNATEKAALYLEADGDCAACGDALTPSWHGDHVIAHSRGGDTDVQNGQALCPTCNLKKGNRMDYVDQFAPRPFQTEVINKVLDNHAAGVKATVVLASPGSGKTITAQATACALYREKAIDYVVVLVPRIVLARQCETDWRRSIVREPRANVVDDWAGDFLLFDERGRIEHIEHTPNRVPLLPDNARGCGLTSTYSSLVAARGQMAFEAFARRHEGRFLLVADEAQFCGDDTDAGGGTRAGEMVKMLHHLAAHTLLMTGTPYRSDGNPLILASYGPPNEETGLRRLLCDVESTYQDGIREGYLRKFEATLTDAQVRRVDPDAGTITEFNLSTDGDDLRDVLRRPDVWRPIVDRVVTAVGEKQKLHPEHRGLIACMEQLEVTAVRNYLRERYPHLRVCVSKSEDGAEAEQALRAFKTAPADLLVTVRKAFIGYDCKSITVVGVLTNYRDPGHLMQLVGRGLRAWDKTRFGSQSCRVIAPDDPRMQEFIRVMRQESEQGLRERAAREEVADEAVEGDSNPGDGSRTYIEEAHATTTRAISNDGELGSDELRDVDQLAAELEIWEDRTKLAAFAKRYSADRSSAEPPAVPEPRDEDAGAAPEVAPQTTAERITALRAETSQIIRDTLSDAQIYPQDPGYSDAITDLTKQVNKAARYTASQAKTEEQHRRRRDAALRIRRREAAAS